MSSLGRLGFDSDVAWIDGERDTWHAYDTYWQDIWPLEA
jgi:hypothetical protein